MKAEVKSRRASLWSAGVSMPCVCFRKPAHWIWDSLCKQRRGRQRTRWSESIPDSTDTNLSKLWEKQGSQRLRRNNTSLSSSPLTLRKSCFSLNFFPNLYLQGPLFFMLLSLHKFLTILFIAIPPPSCFSFSISLGVAVSASPDNPSPTIYTDGDWLRSPVPAKANQQRVEFGTEPRVPRGWRRSPPPDTGHGNVTMKRKPTGQKHLPEETRGQTGWEGRGLSSGASSPESQDPGDNAASPGEERSGPSARPGVERMRLGTAELINPPRRRELYVV